MKVLKKTVSVILLGGLILNSSAVNALENNNDEISGQVTYAVTFTQEEAKLYKASIADTLNSVKEEYKKAMSMTNDEDKIKYYMNEIKILESRDLDDLFEIQKDGMYEMNIPHLNSEISIDGKEYRTDKDGFYSIDKDEAEDIINTTQEVTLSSENVEISDLNVKFDENKQSNDIKIVKTFEEFADGIKSMSENMNKTEAQVKQKFYPKVKVGSKLGNGAGRSQVCKDTNIVVCNKHDKDTKSINSAQFALQNSDCSKSVKLGSAYPYAYPYSFNCVKEAVASIDGKGNAYCTGTNKMKNGTNKGSHINCSWFKGIEHSESFHTHIY
ncbi:hypothetical protein [uncultured Clostridium sp.]|uniref:hypothetical protein n=1 Tax=uncultured Clostridium sp. TaxID=59620 RepID=UPI00258CBB47|nr:hypothetical protein [uncultured Clostridium sp.]